MSKTSSGTLWDRGEYDSVGLYRKRLVTWFAHVPFVIAYAATLYAAYISIGVPYQVCI